MLFLFFPTGPMVEPPPASITIVAGNWTEAQSAASGDWSEGQSASGNYSQTQTATGSNWGQGLSVASGNWSEAI